MSKGFRRFDVHVGDETTRPALDALADDRSTSFLAEAGIPAAIDPETAARRYLRHALGSPVLPAFTEECPGGQRSGFRRLGTESFPFTPVRAVKFRQTIHDIPVYGSLVTVEVDERNDLVSITSHLGDVDAVDPIAKVAPDQVIAAVQERSGNPDLPAEAVPLLHYYYDEGGERWRLTYIVRDVPYRRRQTAEGLPCPWRADIVVDAHTGETIAELPRTSSVNDPLEMDSLDELEASRRFTCLGDGNGGRILHDPHLNIKTHDFEFGDTFNAELPGRFVGTPPEPWNTAAVSAHANMAVVAQFLRRVLGRFGIKREGDAFVSTVNCGNSFEQGTDGVWANAYWTGEQVLFGQRRRGDRLISYAAALDVVAHEVFHGISGATAGLTRVGESGALSESYSDIFGVIVANHENPSIPSWKWTIGADLFSEPGALRDISDPSRKGHPAHMRGFDLSKGTHANSAIHSFAAYKIIAAVDEEGNSLFDPASLAQLFYMALLLHNASQSRFADSRIAVLQAARTRFRDTPDDLRKARLRAIERAFDDTGIV